MIDFAAAGIVTIQTSAVVGRNPGQAATDSEEQVVVLRGSEISRRHARIWIDNAELRVQDLGSSNGTVLRRVVGSTHDVPQEPEALTVLVGDALVIGPVEATFVGWKLDD